MSNIIHYDNDLFYLTYMTKRITEGLKLEIDPSVFKLHFRNELAFLTESITFFYDSLKTTNLKVNRTNYLKKLFNLNQNFIELINLILNGQSPLSSFLKEDFTQLKLIKDQHIKYENEIKHTLRSLKKYEIEETEALSEEEYRVLFRPDEEG